MNRDRRKRDLRWCLASEPLMTADAWCRFDEPRIDDLVLPSPRHPHHFRLGQHFEQILSVWLSAHPDYHLVDHNLQVNDGKHTVGEFDFLVDVRGSLEHWEAAVKFYLGAIETASMDNWFGPNTTDRFGTKYQRLVSHQLVLAKHPVAAQQLADRKMRVDRSRCFMKGRLFHPWSSFSRGSFDLPDGINPNHERGWWISYGEFLREHDDAGYRYVYLPKSLWLSPLAHGDFSSPLSYLELAEYLASPHAEPATHVAIVGDDGEVSRGFVVNQKWLNHAEETRTAPATATR